MLTNAKIMFLHVFMSKQILLLHSSIRNTCIRGTEVDGRLFMNLKFIKRGAEVQMLVAKF